MYLILFKAHYPLMTGKVNFKTNVLITTTVRLSKVHYNIQASCVSLIIRINHTMIGLRCWVSFRRTIQEFMVLHTYQFQAYLISIINNGYQAPCQIPYSIDN